MPNKTLLLAVSLCLMVTPSLAGQARFTDAAGRWVCQPDQAAWPQVLIDFTEDAYRRCDQNTCVTYKLGTPTATDGMFRIRFSPGGDFETADTGGPYRETIVVAGQTIRTTGHCAFRGVADIYEPRP